jgi:hypothetical protein
MTTGEDPRKTVDTARFAGLDDAALMDFARAGLAALAVAPTADQVRQVIDNLRILQGHARIADEAEGRHDA